MNFLGIAHSETPAVMRGFCIYCDHQGRLYDSHFTDGKLRLGGISVIVTKVIGFSQEDIAP